MSSYPYGLPINLPIDAYMEIGERESEELEWLLDHGEIGCMDYQRIVKVLPDVYQLWDGYAPNDTVIGIYPSLEALLKNRETKEHEHSRHSFPLSQCYWIAGPMGDFFPQLRVQRNMPWLERSMRVVVQGKEGRVSTSFGSGYLQIYTYEDQHLGLYHPTWETVYYNDQGEILADYRKKKENVDEL